MFSQLKGAKAAWRWAALVACVTLAAVTLSAPGPDINLRSAIALHDFGHVVAFGLVTALLTLTLGARPRPTVAARIRAICVAAGAALGLGAAVELAQAVSGSHGDPWDVLRDGAGALSAALILVALDPRISSRGRMSVGALASVALTTLAYPVFAALEDEARAKNQFPVLANFETAGELSRFHLGEGARPTVVRITDDEGQSVSAMQLHWPAARYPGLELRYFPRDWRGMHALKLIVVNPEPTPIEITVRIDDIEYRSNLLDRYNRAFALSPGLNRIEIPLSDVEFAPRDRRLDLGRVHAVLVFAVNLDQPRRMIIGPISLVPS